MSKCQVIPLQGKVRAKHAEAKITSYSAMLADGVASVLSEPRHARIYDFQRPGLNGVHGMSDVGTNEGAVQHGLPRQEP